MTTSSASARDLLDTICSHRPPPFAILFRPTMPGQPVAEVMIGDVIQVPLIADLPADDPDGPPVLAIVPFRQLAERGFEVVDDGAPLLALRVRQQARLPLADLLDRLPPSAGPFDETGYDVADDVYERMVRDVLAGEIAAGEGSNFVLHRSVTGRLGLPAARAALGALSRLLTSERQAYWTFAVHTPQLTLVGATPERHISLDAGIVRMNPISGTLRHPAGGHREPGEALDAALAFLADPKERDELWMVLDEELKMMAQVGDLGGRVAGPYLKEMAHLAHTEYLLEGATSADARAVLSATLFAPTVTGSPIRNAARVIARHEGRGRGYYGGVLALLDHDHEGRQRMDAPILIRTAHISPDGAVAIPAGATLVRGSQPEAELAETRAKAAGILAAFCPDPASSDPASPDPASPAPASSTSARPAPPRLPEPGVALSADPLVIQALQRRNDTLASFWLHERAAAEPGGPAITVIDAEDDFTAMLAHLVRSLGLVVQVRPWTAAGDAMHSPGPVVLGPGPGDPADQSIERIAVLHRIARARLAAALPTVGICLGHQVLGLELGLRVRRLPFPDQGVQALVQVHGVTRRVGFYNSYALVPPAGSGRGSGRGAGPGAGCGTGLQIDQDETGTRVVALRGPGVCGLQFHPESVLTTEGRAILAAELDLLTAG
jgi:phenazine biosynthesis protein phzE